MSTDRIEKNVVLRAPRSRVWQAISDSREFGSWFGVRLDGAFAPGRRIRGPITHPGYEHLAMEVLVERVEPERYLSFRWHPHAIDPAVDYSKEEPTLVEFVLDEVPEGTALKIVESGFDRVPPERRATAFRANDGGWTVQAQNLERHVT